MPECGVSTLWIRHYRRLVLSGVALNNSIVRGEPALSIELGKAWQPTFDAKPFNEQAARDFRKLPNSGPNTSRQKYIKIDAYVRV